MSHDWKIDDVIPYEARFFLTEAVALQYLQHGREFVHAALLHVVEFQVATADGHGLGTAARDDPDLEAAYSRQRDAHPVMRVEAFGLYRRSSGGIREQINVSVGHYPVNIEKNDLYFFGTR